MEAGRTVDPARQARRRQTHSDHARGCERPHVHSLHRLSVAGHPERPAAALDVVRLFRPVELGLLDLIHHELYVKCREANGREASPTAAVISQSVKGAEKGGLRLIRRATTRERSDNEDVALRSRARIGTFSSIRKAC